MPAVVRHGDVRSWSCNWSFQVRGVWDTFRTTRGPLEGQQRDKSTAAAIASDWTATGASSTWQFPPLFGRIYYRVDDPMLNTVYMHVYPLFIIVGTSH